MHRQPDPHHIVDIRRERQRVGGVTGVDVTRRVSAVTQRLDHIHKDARLLSRVCWVFVCAGEVRIDPFNFQVMHTEEVAEDGDRVLWA